MYYSRYQQPNTHLISVNKLTQFMTAQAPNLVILDVSIPMPGEQRDCYAEFQQRHIPGARFLNLKECKETETDNQYMLPTREKFQDFVEQLGVSSYSKVVVYDANEKKGMFSSPRGWYMFRVFGHREVYVLDGGLQNWVAEGKETESGDAQPCDRSQYPSIQYNAELVLSLEDVKKNIEDSKFQVLDARSPGRFNGTAPEPRPDIKPGHIPNSQCMFWTQFLENGVYKSPEKIAEVYKAAGVDPLGPHVATCGAGVTACFIALSSYVLGNYKVPVYDGAWCDWFLHAPDDLKVDVPK